MEDKNCNCKIPVIVDGICWECDKPFKLSEKEMFELKHDDLFHKLHYLTTQRNKLNRQISTLKKATLGKCKNCGSNFDDDECPQSEYSDMLCINCDEHLEKANLKGD